MTSYPCRCNLSFFAPARDNIGSNADVSHKLALPFLDHQLDDSALVEVNIEVALPLGVNRPLALYQLHTDVCHIRGYDEMRPDASVGQQQTASDKRGRKFTILCKVGEDRVVHLLLPAGTILFTYNTRVYNRVSNWISAIQFNKI